jgi:hypothetical protein
MRLLYLGLELCQSAAPKRYLWYNRNYYSRTAYYPTYPSAALDHIAQRLISTQAVRDRKDRHIAHGRFLIFDDDSSLFPFLEQPPILTTAQLR